MIYQLTSDDYEKVRPLFKELEWNRVIIAVIEGTCPGDIYVDDVETPKTALMVSPEGYYLAGYEDNDEFNREFVTLVDTKIIPEKMKEGEENISLNYYPPTWEDKIEVILKDKFPVKVHGYYYKFDTLKIDWRKMVPPNFCMVHIDEVFLRRIDLKNIDEVVKWVNSNWNSPESFLKNGVGFCLLHNNTIVSWCLTDCITGNKCEIGITTDEDYRKRGFATATVAATVEYCLSQGFTDIGWHTGSTNVGSQKTAEKVGFEKVLKDTYHFFWFYPVDNFIEHGYFSWLKGNFRESAEWYERAIAVAESGGYDSFQLLRHSLQSVSYYAACSWALAGEKDASFRNLGKAAAGITDPRQFAERIKGSEHLKSLHRTEEWKTLIENLENKCEGDKK